MERNGEKVNHVEDAIIINLEVFNEKEKLRVTSEIKAL